MGKNSTIEWTDHSLNFWWGCREVSPGCDHCYAKTLSERFGYDVWGTDKPRKIIKSAWDKVLAWNKEAEREGVRKRVFCQSMSDFFELFNDNQQRAELNDLRFRVLHELVPATPNLDWLFLTKRVGNVKKMCPTEWIEQGFPSNVWLGISVVNQEEADRDIPKLLKIPVETRFLSIEPMLSEITLPLSSLIHWVICGGESGHHARPLHPDWVRALRDECVEVGTPFFFKQWGEWINNAGIPNDNWNMISGKERFQFTNEIFSKSTPYTPVYKVGKKAAGRLLDGKEWKQIPE